MPESQRTACQRGAKGLLHSKHLPTRMALSFSLYFFSLLLPSPLPFLFYIFKLFKTRTNLRLLYIRSNASPELSVRLVCNNLVPKDSHAQVCEERGREGEERGKQGKDEGVRETERGREKKR